MSAGCTVLVLRMAHRKWKEFKQQPSMLPGPAVPGGCLVSFHNLWAILSTSTVQLADAIAQMLMVLPQDVVEKFHETCLTCLM